VLHCGKQEVYESDNYQNDWDGEDHSDGGVYYYVLILKDGTSRNDTVTVL